MDHGEFKKIVKKKEIDKTHDTNSTQLQYQ